ncbi:MAG: cation-translocating P-type ATPase [Anaerolineaceae bacterium]|nr:cation-translocating P-type ATPase [Anaerolineaceae bacterium]
MKKTEEANTLPLKNNWHSLGVEDTLNQLNTKGESGLSSGAAKERLEKYGLNQLQERPRTPFFVLVLNQLKSFVIIILLIASVISALLGDYVEAGAIMAIVVLNAILGVVQESRAEAALAALKKLAAPEAQVLRDGRRVTVPGRELVPGDIIFLEAGNYVPADIRLLEAVNLRVEEAALTGESLAVEKDAAVVLENDVPIGDRRNTVFMGTLISYGRGHGVVVSTGMFTQLGLIATMLQSVEDEQTPLQKRLDQLAKILGWATLGICAIVFAVGIIRTHGSIEEIVEIFMIAVSLAIAAVPEGLPAVVTISLALGMREMVKRHALIRRLASVEALGSATIICSDKTGTLTQNEMTITRLWANGQFIKVTGSGYKPDGKFKVDDTPIQLNDYPAIKTVLWVGALNNDSQMEATVNDNGETTYRIIGDPTEGSLIVAAAKAGVSYDELQAAYPRVQEVPFDSVRKRMITLHAINKPDKEDFSPFIDDRYINQIAVVVKGAPDLIMGLCTKYQTIDGDIHELDDRTRQRIADANDVMTKDALRVLGMAFRIIPKLPKKIDANELEQGLIFTGLSGMIDPARGEVAPALITANIAGIRTMMITGDYPNTAQAIAESIGLLRPGRKVMSGENITAFSEQELQEIVRDTDVFARVSPEHKLRIVDALRSNGEIVAMTGDGVNDAPAIKHADIGVAMGITGTDVAKETADMVLTDDNYASIVSAIEQGRIIYSNIRKFVYFLISCNVSEICVIFLATIFGWPPPLTAIQLLWLNLITDGAPALALSTEKGDPDIMNQKPRPVKEPIINRNMQIGIVIQTVAITAVTLIAFYIGRYTDSQHIEFAETMAFVTLSCSELLRAYTARSEYYPILKIGPFGNKFMNLAVLSSLVLIMLVVYVPFLQTVFNTRPLGWLQWSEIIPLLIIPSIAAELTKLFFTRRLVKKV